MALVGKIAFIVGLIIAVIAAWFPVDWFIWVLAILGLIAGFLNVQKEETQSFLLAAIGLLMSATAVSQVPLVGGVATAILGNLVIFIAAAILVVALRSLFNTMRN